MKIEVLLTDKVEKIDNFENNRKLFEANKFEAKKNQMFYMSSNNTTEETTTLIVGTDGCKSEYDFVDLGASIGKKLNNDCDLKLTAISENLNMNLIEFGIILSTYRFENFKSKKSAEINVNILDSEFSTEIENKVNSIFWVRDMVNFPALTKSPEFFQQKVEELIDGLNIDFKSHNEEWIKENNMGGVIGVSQGSERSPKFLIGEYNTKAKKQISLIGSNDKKGKQALLNLIHETKNKNLKFMQADLSSIKDIKLLAKKLINEKLDILINNAGALYYSRNESVDKIEKTFALNHLSYFALTNLLLKYKVIKNGGRIINVASGAHRGVNIDFNNLEMSNNYNGWICYKKSKLCNILFTKKLSDLISKKNITVNCLHPGFVKTEFGKNNRGIVGLVIKFLMNFFAITVEEGAKTIIHLANNQDLKNITGKYFYKSKINQPSQFAENKSSADQLWDVSVKILKSKDLTL